MLKHNYHQKSTNFDSFFVTKSDPVYEGIMDINIVLHLSLLKAVYIFDRDTLLIVETLANVFGFKESTSVGIATGGMEYDLLEDWMLRLSTIIMNWKGGNINKISFERNFETPHYISPHYIKQLTESLIKQWLLDWLHISFDGITLDNEWCTHLWSLINAASSSKKITVEIISAQVGDEWIYHLLSSLNSIWPDSLLFINLSSNKITDVWAQYVLDFMIERWFKRSLIIKLKWNKISESMKQKFNDCVIQHWLDPENLFSL